jgi:regulatory protein
MRTVTALHPRRGGRIGVDLDGEPWRTLPTAAVASAGLTVGSLLDRARARELRRAIRRVEAIDDAARALARRERSVAELAARLERRGVPPADREAALQTMIRFGYLDDERVAAGRARALAERGYGDEAIRFDLERRGIEPATIGAAIEELEPEAERASGIVAASGAGAGTARTLRAKGFSAEAIEAVGALAALALEHEAEIASFERGELRSERMRRRQP